MLDDDALELDPPPEPSAATPPTNPAIAPTDKPPADDVAVAVALAGEAVGELDDEDDWLESGC